MKAFPFYPPFLAVSLLCYSSITHSIAHSVTPPIVHPTDHSFSFTIQSWARNCAETNSTEALNCDIAKALTPSFSFEGNIRFPSNAGEVQPETFYFKSPEGASPTIQGEVKLFAIYPKADSPWPPYFQIQLEVIEPARIFCSQSVKRIVPMIFPPITCTVNEEESGQIKQLGMNLIQN